VKQEADQCHLLKAGDEKAVQDVPRGESLEIDSLDDDCSGRRDSREP
jgi:hypothetical protein